MMPVTRKVILRATKPPSKSSRTDAGDTNSGRDRLDVSLSENTSGSSGKKKADSRKCNDFTDQQTEPIISTRNHVRDDPADTGREKSDHLIQIDGGKTDENDDEIDDHTVDDFVTTDDQVNNNAVDSDTDTEVREEEKEDSQPDKTVEHNTELFHGEDEQNNETTQQNPNKDHGNRNENDDQEINVDDDTAGKTANEHVDSSNKEDTPNVKDASQCVAHSDGKSPTARARATTSTSSARRDRSSHSSVRSLRSKANTHRAPNQASISDSFKKTGGTKAGTPSQKPGCDRNKSPSLKQ